ncbi:helix-turn-helix transcriptional regulator [Aquipseudomonas campi]
MTTTTQDTADSLIKLAEVIKLTGLSRTTIYRRVNAETFPTPVKLSDSEARNAPIAWSRAEILAWIEERKKARTVAAA